MQPENLDTGLDQILLKYSQSFTDKIFTDETAPEDDLMLVFGLTQLIKAENKQYWGRELGFCWERLIKHLCRNSTSDFKEAPDPSCDLILGTQAIDTKYRIGSGDAGTLKNFRQNARHLKDFHYRT